MALMGFAPFGDGRLMGDLSVGSQGVAHGYSCAIPFGIEEGRHRGLYHFAIALPRKRQLLMRNPFRD